MKLRLTKDLPGAKAGATAYQTNVSEKFVVFGEIAYGIEYLLSEGWAEEVVENSKSVKELRVGDIFYVLWIDGDIEERNMISSFKKEITQGSIALTREEAQMEKLRRESRAEKGEIPKRGDIYWVYRTKSRTEWFVYEGENYDIMHYHNGNCKKTEEEAKAWGAKYSKAFGLN